jgi:UDP-N-acetylmuramoyl-L-alanyl-D-glutamate--2,6-diaminopimelate ligase
LTNITAEHLDYHKTIEEYANVKKKLFKQVALNEKNIKLAVFPKDDDY